MPSNFNRLFASMTRIFAKADSDALRDLEDALDINGPTVIDQFNQSDKGNRPRVDTGITLAASGKGAETAIQEYSKDIQPGNGIAQGYQALADQLCSLGERMQKSETAIVAISQFFATAMKGDAAATFGAGDDDEKDDDDKKDDDAEKSAKVADLGGVSEFFRALSGASRTTGKTGLATPPNMSVIRKARTSLADILDADDGREFPAHARLELASIQSAMANLDGGMMRDTHLTNLIKRASPQAREALVKANITF
jgi:hypothetical protein